MLLAIIGESCTGKSILADKLCELLNAQQFTGKDYLRLAKNEDISKKLFQEMLSAAVEGETLVYVISEKEHLVLLPDGAIKILMTADLDIILARFAARLHGRLPIPVKQMLERKHGMFDGIAYSYRIHNSENEAQVCEDILAHKRELP